MSRTDERIAELEAQVRWLRSRMPVPLAGEFLETATSVDDALRVRAFGYDDGEHAFGPVVWAPRVDDAGDPVYPQAGDAAYLIEADDGTWIAIGWQPA